MIRLNEVASNKVEVKHEENTKSEEKMLQTASLLCKDTICSYPKVVQDNAVFSGYSSPKGAREVAIYSHQSCSRWQQQAQNINLYDIPAIVNAVLEACHTSIRHDEILLDHVPSQDSTTPSSGNTVMLPSQILGDNTTYFGKFTTG